MHVYEHACRATQGARHYQEDQAAFLAVATTRDATGAGGGLAVPPRRLVAVLADGMGGHAGGAVASRMACEGFLAAWSDHLGLPASSDRLLMALESCNAALADHVAREPLLSGMGSTLIGAEFGPDGILWISVGDSPLYLWRNGEIATLNADHSLAPELDRLAEVGRISRAEALADPRRHMLRSAVTGEEIPLIDQPSLPTRLYPGDYVLLASDGLQTLEDEEIAAIVTAYADAGSAAVSEALIRRVEDLRAPHQDNATVVAVRPVTGATHVTAAPR
jgi:protein phosphatase